jgi:metal transporter CNNM
MIKLLLEVHVKENVIDQQEADLMTGALMLRKLSVRDAMTKIGQTFMIAGDEKLDLETIRSIFKTRYYRIPVYEKTKNNIIGILLVKDLIFLDPEDNVPVKSFMPVHGWNSRFASSA